MEEKIIEEIQETVDDCFDCNPVSHVFKIDTGYEIDITLPYSHPDGLTSEDFNLYPVFRELKSIGFQYISVAAIYRVQEGDEPEDECEHIELFVKRDF